MSLASEPFCKLKEIRALVLKPNVIGLFHACSICMLRLSMLDIRVVTVAIPIPILFTEAVSLKLFRFE
jgi:hypothetical protein